MDIIYLLGVLLGVFLLSYLPTVIILKSYFNLSDDEIIATSFGFSFFILSLISFVIYLLKLPTHFFSSLFTILIIVIIFFLKYKKRIDISHYLKREIFVLYLLYFIFILSVQFLYPVYGGGGWYGDWYEHYERGIFFLYQYPLDYKFLHNMYSLPARTPLFNLTATFYLSLFGDSFSVYQITSTLLNTTFLLPLYLLVKEIKGRKFFFITMAVIILNPFFIKMTTFTFTKSCTAYYIILAIYFYIKFNKFSSEKKYLYLCSTFFALAYLTHQYATSYIFAVFLHILFRRNFSNLIIFLATIVILLVPWHIFSFYNFGIKETIFATPAFSYEGAENIMTWLHQRYLNLQGAFLPVMFIKFTLRNGIEILKDNFLLLSSYERLLNFYTGAIPAVLTLTGTIFLFYSSVKRSVNFKKVFDYPYSFFALVIIVGFAGDILLVNNKGIKPLGMAQNGMMPLCLLLIVFLSSMISNLSRKELYLIFCGIYLEFVLTTLLFFYLLNQNILFDGNSDLVTKYQLVFLKDYLGINWIFTFLWVIILQLIILKILFLNFFKK